MNTGSLWLDQSAPRFPSLNQNLTVDVLVIGGGITGVTAAWLLKKAGKKVALLERHRVVGGESGHTTAHLTYPTDTRLTTLVKRFGKDHAQAAWDAGAAAMQQISDSVRTENIDCELRQIPAFLYAAQDASLEEEGGRLMDDFHAASELGFDSSYVQSAPLTRRPAVRFANQLKFHPGKYVHALAQRIPGDGCHVFEDSEVHEFNSSAKSVTSNGFHVFYESVFIATHVPVQGNSGPFSTLLFQTKLALYSSYVIGARMPPGSLPEALWWDTASPYFYLRVDRHETHDYVIAGGEDHKTGQEENTEACYARLAEKLQRLIPGARFDRRWSGQVIETNDGLPFIGENEHHQFIATGFSGTGMTWGTVAAMMFRDKVLGTSSPWESLLSVHRKPLLQTWDYLKENKDYPYYLIKGLMAESGNMPDTLPAGEGRILCKDGRRIAAYRREDGTLCLLSPVCPHLGCTVTWNNAEKTWDCPCHGSRFTATGELLGGPAESPLEPIRAGDTTNG